MAKTQKTRRQMMNSKFGGVGVDDMPGHFLKHRTSTHGETTETISTALTLFVLHQDHP